MDCNLTITPNVQSLPPLVTYKISKGPLIAKIEQIINRWLLIVQSKIDQLAALEGRRIEFIERGQILLDSRTVIRIMENAIGRLGDGEEVYISMSRDGKVQGIAMTRFGICDGEAYSEIDYLITSPENIVVEGLSQENPPTKNVGTSLLRHIAYDVYHRSPNVKVGVLPLSSSMDFYPRRLFTASFLVYGRYPSKMFLLRDKMQEFLVHPTWSSYSHLSDEQPNEL